MAKGSELHRAFCNNVRERRQALELTQSEVASRLIISQPAYAAIEAGRRIPGLDVVERVALALETSVIKLLGEFSHISG